MKKRHPMGIMQRHCIAVGSICFIALLVNLYYIRFIASLVFLMLLLLSMSIGFMSFRNMEAWRYTGKTLKKWLRNHQNNLDSLFCLYVSIHTKGGFQSCVNREELEGVYELCAQELIGYFGAGNVQRMTHSEFAVLRNFPSSNGAEENEKGEYQEIVCQTVVQRLQSCLFSHSLQGLPPLGVTVGSAASGLRYRMETLEHLVDLAYVTNEEAKRRRKAWLVADAVIRAKKLDIDECKQGFLSEGWEAEFNPFFQPIVDPVSFSVIGAESLARWQLGGFRLLPARVFKDIACELYHIETIDLIIITKTLQIIRTMMLSRQIPYTFKIVLNVSNESLKKGFAHRMLLLAEQHGLQPAQVEFDIKDSALSLPAALREIRELRENGFLISLDIFTETAFDLQAFVRADFDSIKLDFVACTPLLQQVYASLKVAAEEKGISVFAKGIENKELLDAAIALQCKYLQGNYFTLPIPEATFRVFMKKYQQSLYLDSSLG
ncbi:MAG: EAL domain-containing protein [Sphaerochaetaceae bacterium]